MKYSIAIVVGIIVGFILSWTVTAILNGYYSPPKEIPLFVDVLFVRVLPVAGGCASALGVFKRFLS